MTIILLILLSIFSAFEEVNQLVQRGSWKKEHFYSFLFWDISWKSFWKNFDSHHFAFGLFVVTMFLFNHFSNPSWIETGIYFLAFWYIRNLGLHIIFPKWEYKRWKYLSPIVF